MDIRSKTCIVQVMVPVLLLGHTLALNIRRKNCILYVVLLVQLGHTLAMDIRRKNCILQVVLLVWLGHILAEDIRRKIFFCVQILVPVLLVEYNLY